MGAVAEGGTTSARSVAVSVQILILLALALNPQLKHSTIFFASLQSPNEGMFANSTFGIVPWSR